MVKQERGTAKVGLWVRVIELRCVPSLSSKASCPLSPLATSTVVPSRRRSPYRMAPAGRLAVRALSFLCEYIPLPDLLPKPKLLVGSFAWFPFTAHSFCRFLDFDLSGAAS
jgi:hypothetical protein